MFSMSQYSQPHPAIKGFGSINRHKYVSYVKLSLGGEMMILIHPVVHW